MKKLNIFLIIYIMLLICAIVVVYNYKIDSHVNNNKKVSKISKKKETKKEEKREEKKEEIKEEIEEEPKDEIKTLKITAAGDCTLGYDDAFGYSGSFNSYLKKNNNDYSYFFSNVKDIFKKDDLTIVNLETTLTNATVKREKTFNFKAPPEYVQILKEGSIEAVNIANNHSHDYEEQGYQDTKKTLEEAGIDYCGNANYYVKEINGIKVGMFGFLDIYGQRYTDVKKAIDYLKKENCDLIIANMHWGIEKDYVQSPQQIKMGHYLVDNGVDLVVGTHPHVIQGIEKYNDKYIIYSLANFSFGGNKNPKDKDTFIYQQTFTFKNGKLQLDDNIKLIPASVSSISNTNDYKPTVVKGEDATRIFNKIMEQSSGFEYNFD